MRLLAAAMGLGLLGACASPPGGAPALSFAAAGQAAAPDPLAALAPPAARTWPDQGQDVLNQRARGFGLVNAPELGRYLNALYARIKAQAGVPAWPGAVHVLASEKLEAYATAAGNIYVSLPWLTSAESEDELAALLSHEFGHIYLHYHQLEGAIADADMAAGTVGVGVAIVNKTAQATGWTQLDSLVAAYALGKGLATTMYGRSQESAADGFGLNLTLKMGYTYDHGMKAFLERVASWEDSNQAREQRRQDKLLAAIRRDALEHARKTAGGGKTPDAVQLGVAQKTGELQGTIGATLQQWTFQAERTLGKRRSIRCRRRASAPTRWWHPLSPRARTSAPGRSSTTMHWRFARSAHRQTRLRLRTPAVRWPNRRRRMRCRCLRCTRCSSSNRARKGCAGSTPASCWKRISVPSRTAPGRCT